ncbi:tyrosine-protein phosphatase non-receptor type 5-like [Saccoglossus kowalevskii]|uniref:protein-tyrosine-phosphatase n=1 Tax=Saccoglossus kowalevskii TaxID=10224 RepID=A0ABM0LWU2_SACKO|nr:PREDICTED: receptor-type tyrosine-protein phosphatase R-like [Saccoglossus kowalevskii]
MGRNGLGGGLVLALNIGILCILSIQEAGSVPVSSNSNGFVPGHSAIVGQNPDDRFTNGDLKAHSRNFRPLEELSKRSTLSIRRRKDGSTGESAFEVEPATLSDSVSGEYVVVVEIGGNKVLNESQKEVLLSVLASKLSVSKNNIVILNNQDNVYDMYIIGTNDGDDTGYSESDLIPAADVVSELDLDQLNSLLSDFSIHDVYPQQVYSVDYTDVPFYETSYFPYIIGAAAAVFVLLVAVTCYCCIRRRRRKKAEKELTHVCFYPPIKPELKTGRMVQPEPGQIYAPVARSQPIKIIKAPGLLERRGSNASLTIDLNGRGGATGGIHYGTPPKESSSEEYLSSAGNRMTRKQLRNSLKNVRALHEEFWDIPMNHPEAIDVPGSGTKNRYRTILPNLHTRVILPEINSDPLSTYINANYIRGYEQEESAFIATQGPMAHTINDFWRMIWFTNAPIIVMITKLKERNKVKCEHYWPHTQGIYGDIEICVDNIIRKDGYILRIMTLKYLDEVRHVKHYWYTAWPDHKTPDTAKQLLELVEDVERHRRDDDEDEAIGPVVVHCSAGLGRTGCFIAISIGVLQLIEESMVDILGIVCLMRLDRGGMIQTNEQYEFIHQALCLYEKCLPDIVD